MDRWDHSVHLVAKVHRVHKVLLEQEGLKDHMEISVFLVHLEVLDRLDHQDL